MKCANAANEACKGKTHLCRDTEISTLIEYYVSQHSGALLSTEIWFLQLTLFGAFILWHSTLKHTFSSARCLFPMNLQLPDSSVIWEGAMIGAQGSRAANLCARKSEASGCDLSSSSAVLPLTACMEMCSLNWWQLFCKDRMHRESCIMPDPPREILGAHIFLSYNSKGKDKKGNRLAR